MEHERVVVIDTSPYGGKHKSLHVVSWCLNTETCGDNPAVCIITKRTMSFLIIYAITAFCLAVQQRAFNGEIVGFVLFSAAIAGVIWAALDILSSMIRRIKKRA